MNKILTILTILLLATQIQGQKEVTVKEAVTKSTEQQVLSQQIVKIYFSLKYNLKEPKYYQQRDNAINAFEKNMDRLKLLIPNDKTRTALQEVSTYWDAFKKVAQWSIDAKGAEELYNQAEGMLLACQRLSESYDDYARHTGDVYKTGELSKVADGLNRVANQRVMTYKMVYNFLALQQGVGSTPNILKRELENLSNEYDIILHDMSAEEVNTRSIRDEVIAIQNIWGNLIKVFDNVSKDSDVDAVLNMSDNIITTSEKVIEMYYALGKKLSISGTISTVADQNMLTQRIAKAYVAVALHQHASKYKREITISIDEFERGIEALLKSAPTEDIKSSVEVVQIMWKNYKKLATEWEYVDAVSAGRIIEKSHIIMASCDRVTEAVEAYALTIPEYKEYANKKLNSENIALLVKTVGKQRIQSQRVVTYYMMLALEQDANLSAQRLKNSLAEYNEGFKLLDASSHNDATIEYELTSAQKEWVPIEGFVANNDKNEITQALASSEALLGRLNRLNDLYEKKMDELLTQADAIRKP